MYCSGLAVCVNASLQPYVGGGNVNDFDAGSGKYFFGNGF